MAEAMDEKTRRVRSLLGSYYGTDDSAATEDAVDAPTWKGSSPARSPLRIDVNTKGFDAEGHVTKLIEKSKMEELLQQHVAWAAEIKNLDSDMQMLVYENYSKFISATDTIRRMKQNVASMEASMDQLLETVTAVQQKSDGVNASLFERRERIEQLNGTRSLLRKVQFIFDLPKRLRKLLREGDLRAAVRAYTGALPVLQEYGSTSFQSCKDEAEEVMTAVTQKLQDRVLAADAAPAQRSEAALLLQQLDHPVEGLMDEVLAHPWEKLLGDVERAATPGATAGSSGGAAQAVGGGRNFTELLNENFVDEFAEAAELFRQIFPMGEPRLVEATRELFGMYMENVQSAFHAEREEAPSAGELVSSLERVSREVARMHTVVPLAQLPDQAGEAVRTAVTEHVIRAFAAHESQITGALAGVPKQIASAKKQGSERHGERSSEGRHRESEAGALRAALATSQGLLLKGTLKLLEDMQALAGGSDEAELLTACKGGLIELLHSELQSLFLSLNTHFLTLCAPPSARESAPGGASSAPVQRDASGGAVPGVVLLLARLSLFIEHKAIPKIAEALAAAFGSTDDYSFSANEISSLFRASGEKLLSQYVEVQARQLSLIIRKSVATPNWLKHKEPKDVRMVADLLLQEVAAVEDDVEQLLEPGAERPLAHRGAGGVNTAPPTSSRQVAGGGAAREEGKREKEEKRPGGGARSGQQSKSRFLERDVAKLFKERVEIFVRLEFTQASVVSAIVKRALKSFQECVRLKTFGRSGYQQMQLDTEYLREPLRCHLDDETVVDTLLDEVCGAAAERCLDPLPLEQSVVDQIIDAKRLKLLDA